MSTTQARAGRRRSTKCSNRIHKNNGVVRAEGLVRQSFLRKSNRLRAPLGLLEKCLPIEANISPVPRGPSSLAANYIDNLRKLPEANTIPTRFDVNRIR